MKRGGHTNVMDSWYCAMVIQPTKRQTVYLTYHQCCVRVCVLLQVRKGLVPKDALEVYRRRFEAVSVRVWACVG